MEVKVVQFDDLGNPIVEEKQVEETTIENEEEGVQVNEEEQGVSDAQDTSDIDEASSEQEGQQEQLRQEQVQVEQLTVDDDLVLNYLKENYKDEIPSLQSLFDEKEKEVEKIEVPEQIQKIWDYVKETGRTVEDYAALNKDWDSLSTEGLIRSYLKYKKPHLDDSEIDFEIKRQFSYDENVDDESEIYAKKIAKKDLAYEAKVFFNQQKEAYSAPLESRVNTEVPQEYKEALDFVNEYNSNLEKTKEENQKRYDSFVEKTEQYFGSQFEGFKFIVGEDKSQVYKPSDIQAIKQEQLDIKNFFSKFLDEAGNVKNPAEYHRALYIASNPDAFAKFFYEQGASDIMEDVEKESKNTDMETRKVFEENPKTGTKIRTFSGDTVTKLKIRRF